jgi:crossover junction endodeoxyribonuclease RusA
VNLPRDLTAKCLDLAGGPGRGVRLPAEAPSAMVRLVLPYPPSLNHYWRHAGAKVLVSREGRAYRKNVLLAVVQQGRPWIVGRLKVSVYARCPDRRTRDIDNLLKSTLDALAHAGVYADDSQIDRLEVERRGSKKGGELLVVIEQIKGES